MQFNALKSKFYLLSPIAFALILSCKSTRNEASFDDIKGAMSAQQDAWNSGDLKGFMLPYWKNDSLVFIGKSGLTYGWNQTLSNYQKSYPNREAMGRLKFTNIKIQALSEDAYWAVGQWQLFRKTDTLQGHYTLVWKFIEGEWRIVSDHSS
jgi:ketosteroid isomerase-like protein